MDLHVLGSGESENHKVRETLVIVQIFNLWFLADLHVWSEESKKRKISMVSGCSLVSMLV